MQLHLSKKLALAIFSAILCYTGLMAQEIKVSGIVTDAKDATSLPGVSVKVKGQPRAVTTNAKGQFSISANPATETLVFTFVGFESTEVKLAGRTSVNVALKESTGALREVVVNVGYGATKKKANLTGAIEVLKAEDFEDLPVANLTNALKDRVVGMDVGVTSGKPGASSSINIRNSISFGQSSSFGLPTEPLYVIDGITVTSADFNGLDASVIDNIAILKDASAAIYGAAGAKGVVLVTTKKGKSGKPKISYTGYFGTSDAAFKPKLLTPYEHAKYLNDGYEIGYASDLSRFSQQDLDFLKTNPYESWYSQLWHSSQLTRHTVNISGGSDKLTFFAGVNYYDEGGNFGKIDANRYGIRTSVDAKVTESTSFTVQLNGDLSSKYRNSNKNSGGDTEDVMVREMYLTPGWVPLIINGQYNNWAQAPNPPTAWNPLALMNSGTYETSENTNLSVNATFNYTPKYLPGLTAKIQYARKHGAGNSKQYYVPYLVYNFVRTGQNSLLYSETPTTSPTTLITRNDRLNQGTSYNKNYQLIYQLSYVKKIGKHSFDATAVMEQTESFGDNYAVYRDGQQIPGVDQFFAFNSGSTTADIKGASESGKRSYLTRANYSFSDKYLVEFIGRYDGSANFAPEHRWGFFPYVGLGWRISDEPFFKNNISFINSLKLRANMGLVGDDRTSKYQWIARYTQAPQAYLFGNSVVNGVDMGIVPNPLISWEKSRTTNLGADASFLRSRLNFSVELWRRHTYDGLENFAQVGLPLTTGTNTGVVNNGIQNSWGTELSLSFSDKINKDWRFNLSTFASFGDNQLVQSFYNNADIGQINEYQKILIGKSSRIYNGDNYGYIAKGILRTQEQVDALLAAKPNYLIDGKKPQVGFMDYVDVNKDGVINTSDITLMYPKGTAPRVNMGFTFGISYKSLKLNTNLNLVMGGKSFVDGDARKVPSTTSSGAAFWNDHWTPETPNAKYPRFDSPLLKDNSTFWARSGTAARINNMTLSFTVPKKFSQKLGISDIRGILTGQNLWDIINPYDYKDAYTSSFIDYPTLRTFSLGLNVGL